MTAGYLDFLASKVPAIKPCGLDIIPNLASAMKPFQRDIVTWALRRGRGAVFAGTGLGKTLQQLAWADAVERETGQPVLVLTPLAVAAQTVAEAEKFDIGGVAYARSREAALSRIVVTNYERAEKFDLSAFSGVVLDESSIIKSQDSKTRGALIEMCRDVQFRLCCTATPAPNDYTELGQHAEFLGVLTASEMLATFFVHDGSGRATNMENFGQQQGSDWRLKGHAEQEFWRWVSDWAVMVRHPRDLGYDEPGYDLPALHRHQVTVSTQSGDEGLFGEVQLAMQRTKHIGLLHKQLVKDSAMSRMAVADYMVMLRKPGDNPEPVSGPFDTYYGDEAGGDGSLVSETRLHGRETLRPGEASDPTKDRYSIAVWQRYAESVWTDISQSDVLSRAEARDEKDERHISPLQLTPIRRCLDLWTNRDDIVFSPFAGIGSELYVALQMGRRALGAELKPSYFRQAVKNCQIAAAPPAPPAPQEQPQFLENVA